MYKILAFLTLTVPFVVEGNVYKHVIGTRGGGFFSNFFGVVNHLAWCKRNHKMPVVWWMDNSYYYVPGGYNGSFNVWEYYFEPISHIAYEPHDVIYDNYRAPDRTALVPSVRCHVSRKRRQEVYKIIKYFIHIKPTIKKKINDFFNAYMRGMHTIGIHFRGTDKWREVIQVDPEYIIAIANEYLMLHANEKCQFLIASDEYRFIELAQQKLHAPVIYYPAQRSFDGRPIHYNQERYHRALLGEEVLIEVQLLARCNFFIHTTSNVSCAVAFFNPSLVTRRL